MADLQNELDQEIHEVVMTNLKKLESYVPGPVKKAGGTAAGLIRRYQADPLFSMFGLDSPEYVNATLGGGTVTSIHRKLGDIYEQCVESIFARTLSLTKTQLKYTASISSGDKAESRTADAYIRFEWVQDDNRRQAIEAFCQERLSSLTDDPRIDLVGVGMEVRHCYQTGDSKRTQADEAIARHFYVSGILPLMPLFCDQSNPSIIRRYRSVWVVLQGMDSYDMVKAISGYDFHDFLSRNRDEYRKPVLTMLKGLTA